MAELPKKVKNLAPQDMKAAINAIIDLIDNNRLHLLECDFAGLNAPADAEQLTYDNATGKWIPGSAAG